MTISVESVVSAEAAAWPRLPLTFGTLMSALRSDNLAAARQAYGDLQNALQPHVSALIAPVGAALGQGETTQAGALLAQMRGTIAAATLAAPAAAQTVSAVTAPVTPSPVLVQGPASGTGAVAIDRLI